MANGLKLEGQRFGHLTVLKKLDERENRYVVWLCRCDCGNEIKVNTRHPETQITAIHFAMFVLSPVFGIAFT